MSRKDSEEVREDAKEKDGITENGLARTLLAEAGCVVEAEDFTTNLHALLALWR